MLSMLRGRLLNPTQSTILILIPLILNVLTLPALAAWENGDWVVVLEDPANILDVGAWSDGQGGMFAAGIHQEPLAGYDRVMVTRLDPLGNELWGPGGIYLPLELNANADWVPLDVLDDGLGGAYIAFSRIYDTPNLYMVAHYDGTGTLDWLEPVDQWGPVGTARTWVGLAPGGYGGVYVVYLNSDSSGNEKIKAVYLGSDGAVLGSTDVFSATTAVDVLFDVTADQSGGFLVSWTRTVSAFPETGAQRVNLSMNRLWGNDGVLLWSSGGHGSRALAPDGSGGAYIVVSGGGQAIGQHLDGSGTKLWPVSGKILHDTQTPYFALATNPDICIDGDGGLFLIHGIENVFVQRVDSSGGFPWGASGVQVASGTDYSYPVGRIAYDGWGGAVLRYNTSYEIGSSGVECKQLQGARVDGDGSILWDNYIWACEYSGGSSSPTPDVWPHDADVIPDGMGGAIFAWSERSPTSATSWEDLRVLAKGLGPDGNPAAPTLKEMHPGDGQVGDTLPVGIFGFYLQADQDFILQRPGQSDLTVTGLVRHSNYFIEGDLDLSTAVEGIYDLVVSTASTAHDTLPGALAVGSPLPCLTDTIFGPHPTIPITGGSRRKADFGPDGKLHMAWLELTGSQYSLYHWDDSMGPEDGDLIFDLPVPSRELAFAVGGDSAMHYVYVEDYTTPYLIYIRDEADGNRTTHGMAIPGGVRCPTVAVVGNTAHIVFESDIGPESWLFHVPATKSGYGTIQDIMSGPGAREADLIVGDEGLMLTFIRDLEETGLREICTQVYNGASWETPQPLSASLSLYSPSIVWDDDERTLVAWIQDATGSDPVLHTCLMHLGVPGPVRWRPSHGSISAVTVGTPGNGVFYMMTQESETVTPVYMYLRKGDGEAFYPKLRLNRSNDVSYPIVAVEYGTHRIGVWWEEYDEGAHPYHYATCYFNISGIPEIPPVAEAMLSVYPNPFNPATRVIFVLPEAGRASLVLYDLRGRRVRTLVDGDLGVGPHTFSWDGRDDGGQSLASGVYFGKLTLPGGKGELITKLALIR